MYKRTHCGDAGQMEEHCDGCDPDWNADEPEDEGMEGDQVITVPDTPLQSPRTSVTHPFTSDLVPLAQSPRGSPSPALTDDDLPACGCQVRSSAQTMGVSATSDSAQSPPSPDQDSGFHSVVFYDPSKSGLASSTTARIPKAPQVLVERGTPAFQRYSHGQDSPPSAGCHPATTQFQCWASSLGTHGQDLQASWD
ncbi:hypothetical protein N7461_008863 [Penicillium sp. DV-2018c]|nr:hypothetical protein N7461_008863 [Penicillium sp. DV-2018c]